LRPQKIAYWVNEYQLRLKIKDSKVSIYSNHIDNNSEFTYEFQNYSTNESEFEIGFNPELLIDDCQRY
jgi:hypothetical protein